MLTVANRHMSPTILHYTLNTGRQVDQPRHPLSRPTIRSLKTLIRQGGGKLPGILADFRCRIVLIENHAACEFALTHGSDLLVASLLCWDERSAEAMWPEAERCYLDLMLTTACREAARAPSALPSLCQHAPRRPDRLPWLARIVLPGFETQAHHNLIWVGDFERCLAWTILTTRQTQPSRRRRPGVGKHRSTTTKPSRLPEPN